MGCISSKDSSLDSDIDVSRNKLLNNDNNSKVAINSNGSSSNNNIIKKIIDNNKININSISFNNHSIIEIKLNDKFVDKFYVINNKTTGDKPMFLNLLKDDNYKSYDRYKISSNEFDVDINLYDKNTMKQIINDLTSSSNKIKIYIREFKPIITTSNSTFIVNLNMLNYLTNYKKYSDIDNSPYIKFVEQNITNDNRFFTLFLLIPGTIDQTYINKENSLDYTKVYKNFYEKLMKIEV